MERSYAQFAEYYDLLGWSDFSRAVFPQLKAFFKKQENKPAGFLDLACGTGTLAFKLAELGIEVTGLDISPEMIEVARAKSTADSTNPRFVIGDMADFELDTKFDMIGCFFDSLNHLQSPEMIQDTFRTAHDHLHPGSWFVFDILTVSGLENWRPYSRTKTNLFFVNQKARFDPENLRTQIKIEAFIRDENGESRHVVENFTEICITDNQLKQFLQRAGFVKYIIKSFNPDEAVEEAERFLVFART